MADPIPTPCPKGQWTKVASGAQAGWLYIQELDPQLDLGFWAFNATGDGNPPLAPMVTSSTAIQAESRSLSINFSVAKDIYYWPLADGASVLPSISTP
jgi:hypothetical protein